MPHANPQRLGDRDPGPAEQHGEDLILDLAA